MRSSILHYSVGFKKIRYPILLIIALYPILAEYYIKGLPINLGDVFFFSYIFIESLLCRGVIFSVNRKILYFSFFLASYNFLIGLTGGYLNSAFNNSFSILKIFVIISIASGFLYNMSFELYKYIKLISIICTIFILYQFVMYNFFGTIIWGNIGILSNHFECYESSFESITRGRFTSFFYEPAHYCIYMAPTMVFSLYYKDFKMSLICILGLALSTSTTGIIIIATAILFYILIEVKSYKKIVIMPSIIICTIIILALDFVDTSKLSMDYFSNSVRVFGALDVFKYFSLKNFIFGVGLNGLDDWARSKNLEFENYSNSLFFLFMSFGFIGSTVVLSVLFYQLKDKRFLTIMLIVSAFILISDQVLFNRNFFHIITCILSTYKISNSEEDHNLSYSSQYS